jgi:hypothetical protein
MVKRAVRAIKSAPHKMETTAMSAMETVAGVAGAVLGTAAQTAGAVVGAVESAMAPAKRTRK